MARIITPLYDLQIRNAKPEPNDYKMRDGKGLFLDIRSSGAKIWRMEYSQPNGKRRILTIGSYPEISLDQARDERKEARKLLLQGIDPNEHKRKEKEIAIIESEATFEKIAREWHETNKGKWQPVPPYTYVKDKAVDPGKIYVYSKVLIVDQTFAMPGSANHNESSMWHDTEDMLAVRACSSQDFPGKLQKELLHTVLSGDLPCFNTGQFFLKFAEHLNDNMGAFLNKRTQRSLVFPYIPPPKMGIGVLT